MAVDFVELSVDLWLFVVAVVDQLRLSSLCLSWRRFEHILLSMLQIPFLVQSSYRRAVFRRLSVVKLLDGLLDLLLRRLSRLARDISVFIARRDREEDDPKGNTPENQTYKEEEGSDCEDDCDLRGVVGRGAFI